MKMLSIMPMAALLMFAPAQVVCVGTTAQCRASQAKACADEETPTNLHLSKHQLLRGRVVDASGAPIGHGHFVQLRDSKTQNILRAAPLDDAGNFDLVSASAGDYRLIVVEIAEGTAKRFGFRQPENLKCPEDAVCKLEVVLKPASTDNPVNFCNPR